ncbi:MAG: ribosome-associated translation inhibitor RaiA [Planctomycetes bacterium]|nr:ribosome-associated translation inhibitor RaiA [Planctomycetota bacterium]
MKITITAKHVKVTPAMKEYAEDKLERLERYFDRIQNIHVFLDKEGDQNVCEIELTTAKHHHIIATVKDDSDMHAAVDLCLDKTERQLKKVKEKLKSHKGVENRKKLGRDVKRETTRLPKEETETYEDVVNE